MLFEGFGVVQTCSDVFGCVRRLLEAFGCIGTRSENFANFGSENVIFAFLEGILAAWDSLWPFPDLRERYWEWGHI